MQKTIDRKLLKELKPQKKPYEIWDTDLRGFILRVQPSGVTTYICEYARHKRITIGPASVLTLTQARDKAKEYIADAVRGMDPMAERKLSRAHTLESFITDKYKQWAETHQRHSREALRKVAIFYPELGNKKLSEVTAWAVEKHRSARLKAGTSPSTANREIDGLRAVLSKAVEWGFLTSHPLSSVKRSKVDRLGTIRYLSPDEDKRLRAALDAREAKRRGGREQFNRWRRERGYKTFPEYGSFTDHLKPMVLLALNTGMRRGELFNLRWQDLDFGNRLVTVVGKTSKSLQTRYIPLNDEAYRLLCGWRDQRKAEDLVFPGRDGGRMGHIKTSWEHLMRDAKIKGFRFHDCRHDFASKLVMAGEDLNTVRELLGHSDIKMTLRYAHLAPKKLAAAVAKLSQAR